MLCNNFWQVNGNNNLTKSQAYPLPFGLAMGKSIQVWQSDPDAKLTNGQVEKIFMELIQPAVASRLEMLKVRWADFEKLDTPENSDDEEW